MRAAWTLILIAACTLVPMPAESQAVAPTPFIRHAEIDYQFPMAVGNAQENLTLYEGENPCPSNNVELDLAQRAILFDEGTRGSTENGCGEIGLLFDAPAARQIFLTFLANREITGAAAQAPVNAVQQFRVYGPDGDVLFQHEYFGSSAGSAPDQLFFYPLEGFGARTLNLTWYFADTGIPTGVAAVPYGQVFAGAAMAPTLILRGVPLGSDLLGSQINVTGNISTTRTFAQILVQPVLQGQPTNVTIRITTDPDRRLEEVRAPDGQVISLDRLATRRTDEGLLVEIPSDQAALHPLGNYVFVFRKDNPLPPPAPPPPPAAPTTIYPLAALLIALPAIPAAFATRTSFGLRSIADPRHRPFVTQIFGTGLIFILAYAGLFIYVISGNPLDRMAVLPLALDGWLLYLEFAALALVFVLLWVAPTRRLVSLMRRDLIISQQAQDQLRRSNKELEQFAYVASHDLQEPLRTITGFSQILRDKYGHKLDKQARTFLDYNADGARRMQRLIHGLLAFSRVESKPLEKTDVDLADVFGDVVRDVDQLRQKEGGTITVHPMPVVRADAVQMRQLFLNLVQNALKYRHPKRAADIVINAETDADYHIVSVRDNGRGIEPEYREKIFDMFQRLEGRMSKIEGTGLGLAVVKKIVARHDGRVWVESIPSGGSIFKVALPRRW